MKFPRLPWGPQVPPTGSEEGVTFTLRSLIACGLIGFAVGVIYATGVGKNHRTLGVVMVALSVVIIIHSSWLMVRTRRQLRVQGRDGRGDE